MYLWVLTILSPDLTSSSSSTLSSCHMVVNTVHSWSSMVVILRRPRSKLANTLMVQTITKVKSFPSSWRRSQWSLQASSSPAVIYLTRRPIVSVVIINWPAEFPWLESCHQKRRFALFSHRRLFIPSVKSTVRSSWHRYSSPSVLSYRPSLSLFLS